jgi:putative tricarboxylic transport membrane protein
MKRIIPMDSVLGLLFVLAGAAIFQQALNLHALPGMNVGPGLFPSIVGGAMAILGAGLVVQGWAQRNEPEEDAPPLFTWFAVGVVAAVIFAIVAMPLLGFIVTGAILSFVVVLMSGGGWLSGLIFSPIATGLIYFLFTAALRVPLPRGILG